AASDSSSLSRTSRSDSARRSSDLPAAVAAHFTRPGHVFPLRARDGGVLERPGHTEAAVDLARLAGLQPVGALCELVNDDGTMMRSEEHTSELQSRENLVCRLLLEK